jgi:hypothetical protein
MSASYDEPGWQNRTNIEKALDVVARGGRDGATWPEVSRALRIHHGHSSAALSTLNGRGRVARLFEKRAGCSIYVLGMYVEGRTVVPYGAPKTYDTVIENLVETLQYEGVPRSLRIDKFGYLLTMEYRPDGRDERLTTDNHIT